MPDAVQTCEYEGCAESEGLTECVLEWTDEDGQDQTDRNWYCWDHARQEGFCPGCGRFWGGVEDFDFTPTGLCEDCRADIGIDWWGNDEVDPEDEAASAWHWDENGEPRW